MKQLLLLTLAAIFLFPACCCWKKKKCKEVCVETQTKTIIKRDAEIIERESGPMQSGIDFEEEDLK